MKKKFTLIMLLLALTCIVSLAQNNSNYGTVTTKVLVEQGNTLFNKKKYAEAKVLYERALATGDKYFEKICKERLKAISAYLPSKSNTSSNSVFSISQDTVFINYLGGDYPIHVNGTNWKSIQPEEDWCKIEVDKKRGIVKIYSSPNESVEERNTTITIKNGNGQKKIVKVTSGAAPEILRSSAQKIIFTPDGETNVVDIDANTSWDLSDVPDWLSVIKGVNDIQFTAKANEENKDRVAQVKVESPTKQEIIINILQGAALDSLAFSKNDLRFGPEGGEEYIRVLTDADGWRFGDFPHWCQLTRIDDNTILVHCTPNEPVDMPREASINVTTGTQTLGINISQEPKPIVHLIPVDGIGGRKISFGVSLGYLYPMISTSSSSKPTFSAVNYSIGNNLEEAHYTSSGGFSVSAFTDIRLFKNLYLNAGLNFLYYKYKNDFSGHFEYSSQLAAQYYMKGTVLGSFKEEYSMSNLDIPIMASYRIPVAKTSHFQINAGPVLSFGISSKLNLSGKTNGAEMKHYKIINGRPTDILFDNGTYTHNGNWIGTMDMYSKKADLEYVTSQGNNGNFTETYEFNASPYKRINFGLRFGVGYEYMGISLSVSYQWMITNLANDKYWNSDRWKIFNNATDLMTGYSQRNNLLLVNIGYTFRY